MGDSVKGLGDVKEDDFLYCFKELTNPQGGQIQIFGYREFCRLWAETVPYIAVMLPASDLCLTCQENANAIMRSTNLPEDVKYQRLKEAEAHLAQAKAGKGQQNEMHWS